MKTYLDCIPCFFRQALFAARAATKDETKARQVLDRMGALLPGIPLDSPPPETAVLVYSAVREITGVLDPFKALKDESIENALSLYRGLASSVAASEDPLRTAVKIAIVGNVIDFGANANFDIEGEIEKLFEKELSIDHFESFRKSLAQAEKILYLADNAGETVFDKILIETMQKDVVYAVRDIPIINDATVLDAENSGVGEVARVLSSGCDAPGTILNRCSRDFLHEYTAADLIISKGQGNLESLTGQKGPLFFLLKVKCPVIAGHLGSLEGEMILKDARL